MKKAITLLELLIVIAIIGIMAAAAVPVASHYIPGIQLSGSARTLSGNLREAQEKTVTEQKQHLIRFYPTGTPAYYEMIRLNNSVEELQKRTDLPSSVSITLAPTITNNQIIFSADGGPSSSGDITLSINLSSKIVNVSPAGFIKIQ